MKKLILLVTLFLTGSVLSYAQCDKACSKENKCCKSQASSGKVTKGYYSIGDNARKLVKSNDTASCCQRGGVKVATNKKAVRKGYYSIGGNADKLATTVSDTVTSNAAPVTKGYYSIGANGRKLKKDKCCQCCGR